MPARSALCWGSLYRKRMLGSATLRSSSTPQSNGKRMCSRWLPVPRSVLRSWLHVRIRAGSPGLERSEKSFLPTLSPTQPRIETKSLVPSTCGCKRTKGPVHLQCVGTRKGRAFRNPFLLFLHPHHLSFPSLVLCPDFWACPTPSPHNF